MAVGNNIIFDPSKEELAVADVALAVSVGEGFTSGKGGDPDAMETEEGGRNLRLLSVRTIDPPSRLTPPGVPNATNTAYGELLLGRVKDDVISHRHDQERHRRPRNDHISLAAGVEIRRRSPVVVEEGIFVAFGF